MSKTLEIRAALDLPAVPVRDAMIAILQELHDGTGASSHAALSLGFRSIRIPAPGHLSVPVEVDIHARPARYQCAIEITASDAQALFPVFRGELRVSPLREYGSEVWLVGNYDPPLGAFGEIVDATVLRGAAHSSLQRFLDWLAGEISARIRRGQQGEIEHRSM